MYNFNWVNNKDFDFQIGFLFGVFIITFIIAMTTLFRGTKYIYIDVNDNIGTSYNCYNLDLYNGVNVCEVEDGVVVVKSYKEEE